MVSELASRSGNLSSDHCVVFLRKTLYSHNASFHSGVSMSIGELSENLIKELGVIFYGLFVYNLQYWNNKVSCSRTQHTILAQ